MATYGGGFRAQATVLVDNIVYANPSPGSFPAPIVVYTIPANAYLKCRISVAVGANNGSGGGTGPYTIAYATFNSLVYLSANSNTSVTDSRSISETLTIGPGTVITIGAVAGSGGANATVTMTIIGTLFQG